MSFEKECSVTLLFCALVLAFICGLLYYRWQDAVEQVRWLKVEVNQLEGSLNESLSDAVF